MAKTYIIDGNSLLFRSFYALFRPGIELMHSADGTPTNAIYAFRNMMKTIKGQLGPDDKMIVCFDTDSKTYRSKELETYKKNRKPCEPALVAQLPLARKLLEAMGIFFYELPGYEGDDIAGSLAVYGAKRGDEITLFTSDKDFLQLLDDNIKVNFLRKGLSEIEVFTKDNIHEKLGFEASQVTDYKGLVGDTSDNFKGIPGIGEKTAVKLLEEYGTLENIIEAMKSQTSKTAQNIVNNADLGRFCKHIATMMFDLPDVEKIYEMGSIRPYDYDTLKNFYKKYDLIKFLKEIEHDKSNASQENDSEQFDKERASSYDNFSFTNKNEKELIAIEVEDINNPNDILSIVPNFKGTNPHRDEVEGFYLSDKDSIYYISRENALMSDNFQSALLSSTDKSTYDIKSLIVICHRLGLPKPKNITFDILLATYLIDPDVESSPLAVLKCYKYESVEPLVQLAFICHSLKDTILEKLKENEELDLFYTVEMPLAQVLADMEIEGFPLDIPTIQKIDKIYKTKLASLKSAIIEYAGHDLNINSPKQVSTLLFDELGLRGPKGSRSTNSGVLKYLEKQHPIISLLLEYRKTNKSITSYTEPLPGHVFSDGKIHANFNQALTTTGRLSMSEPNLQNISIRNEESKEIRKAFFYPDHKYYILSYDYSQIELRMIAHLANITPLIEAFKNNTDIHTLTASLCFHVPLDEVTHEMRRKAKAVNFGIVYGISSYGLSEQLDISVSEAKEIMDNFHQAFRGLKEYDESVVSFAQNNEYVKTILNRRRYLKDINSTNHTLREFSKRAAVNATVQGSAADLIKVAMIEISKLLENYETKMVLQIHDELIFKVPPHELEVISPKIKEIMENVTKLSCPLEVEGSYSFVWYDAK